MSLRWISVNKKLVEGVKLINLLSNTQFSLLLRRTNESDGNDIVSEEEHKKLGEVLHIDLDSVNLLLQSLMHIWKQSLKVILKPTDLLQNLTEVLHFQSEKSEEFVKIWTEKVKLDYGDLEKQKKLDSIAWEINLEAASCYEAKELMPKARLQLNITDFVNDSKREHIILDLSEEQLTELYNTIEKVQTKLDNIQSLSQQS
ncbi:hypothetical protein Trydic_g12812 [Trypoxylus dichotomus]